MIKGLTHDKDGTLNHSSRYRGKISTGYAPGETPNTTNHPVACGFFRMLKEKTQTQKIGASNKEVVIKSWVTNTKATETLEAQNKASKTPRMLEFVSLFHSPQDFWESSMAMFSSTEGLVCRSNGEGTKARYLDLSTGSRNWIDREFNGIPGCAYHNCPDYVNGGCKPFGLMKIFPTCDLSTMPYRFETRSINTIIGIESSLNDLWTLLNAAHTIRQMEAGDKLPFDGFFGAKLFLVHRKIKSGGRDVFVSDLFPSPDFNTTVMEPIKRGLEKKKSMAMIAGAAGSMNLLEQATESLIASGEGAIPMDLSEEREIAVNFGADAEELVADVTGGDDLKSNEGAKTLMDDGPSK